MNIRMTAVAAGSVLLAISLLAGCIIELPDRDASNRFACETDEDCISGFTCRAGKCMNADVAGDSDIGGDSAPAGDGDALGCSTTTECDDGNSCTDDQCSSGTCNRSPIAEGTSCSVTSAQDGVCDGSGVCLLATGQPCASSSECYSGACADSICCDSTCGGECDRCDLAGSLGTCTLDDTACAGECGTCGGNGTCTADNSACAGDCGACMLEAGAFVCAADETLCPAAGATLCTSCEASGGGFSCAFDDTLSNTDCGSGRVCAAAGECASTIGGPCTSSVDCSAGTCEAGFCCDAGSSPCIAGLSAGESSTCSLKPGGAVRCWGSNSDFQLGVGGTISELTTPGQPLNLGAIALAGRGRHQCIINGSRALRCWGNNQQGQLGADTGGLPSSSPHTALAGNVDAVSTFTRNTCALSSTGTVMCWGSNDSGQLGDISLSDPTITPAQVPNVTGATAVSIGYRHACAIVAGQVLCWGENTHGELGTGDTTDVDAAMGLTPVVGLSGAVEVACGQQHTCARLDGGQVYCWGSNDRSQLGRDPSAVTSSPRPEQVVEDGAVALRVGAHYGCALLDTGAVRCWGDNSQGQLGISPGTGQSHALTTVDPPLGSGGFTLLATGRNHACARLAEGSIQCWGGNGSGQLGNGEHQSTHDPVDPAYDQLGVGRICGSAGECASGTCETYSGWTDSICLYDGATCAAQRSDNYGVYHVSITYQGSDSFSVDGYSDDEGYVTECDSTQTSEPASPTSPGTCGWSITATHAQCEISEGAGDWTYFDGSWR